ncbi:FAD-dependent oxidoreductase [Streptomyces sp. ODS28]|uniref:NAD(P)/FAD-dependent oxidoreductase n=1 Tax=Streptomyces sp. ODS28 TaxID=3136688 RepID=UPI0031EC3A11
MKNITVVGASLAGLSTVRALRAEGYDGEITVVGAEEHRPYDRPPLSKDFLSGAVEAESLELADGDDYEVLGAQWLLGQRALRLDPASRTLELSGGRQVLTDGVVVATGATPRVLPGAEGLAGIHTLRTLDDAVALRDDLRNGPGNVVILGAGFIGAEVASTARKMGLDVTVVDPVDVPLERALGREMGELADTLHGDHGVRRVQDRTVGFTGEGRVTGVCLAGGEVLPADTVLVGVGVQPVTEWLAGSGVAVDDGVVCDAGCASSVPNVVAVGDVARRPDPFTGRHARVEHWTSAMEQAGCAVRTLLAGVSEPPPVRVPYFWSDQFGVRLQFAGYAAPGARPRIVEGDVQDRSFTAVYYRQESPVAVLSMNRPKPFNRLRRTLVAPSALTAA